MKLEVSIPQLEKNLEKEVETLLVSFTNNKKITPKNWKSLSNILLNYEPVFINSDDRIKGAVYVKKYALHSNKSFFVRFVIPYLQRFSKIIDCQTVELVEPYTTRTISTKYQVTKNA